MKNLIAVSVGDLNGIGIELLIKNYKIGRLKQFVLFSNIFLIKKYLKKKNIHLKINQVNIKKNVLNFKIGYLNIYSYKTKNIVHNTYDSIKFAYKECSLNKYIGIITLPIRKDLIKKKIDSKFMGHTEFFEKLDNKKSSNMILYNKKIMVSTITTHIDLKSVHKLIRKENYLYDKILNLNNCLIKDFNIKSPKLIISGLNPHAGENGTIGTEEIDIITPVVKKLLKLRVSISGPFSADSMLNTENIKKYDCFIFIYHDQALIPFKYISKFSGVNYTGNLDIIRTSPDHGTAYGMVGKNNVSDISLINCFKLTKRIYTYRNHDQKSKKIIKSKLFNR